MIHLLFKQDSGRPGSLRMAALMDGLLAFVAVGLVAFGIDALLRAMH